MQSMHRADLAITGPTILRVTITRPDGSTVSKPFPRDKSSRVVDIMRVLGYRLVSWRDMVREAKEGKA